MWPVKSIEMAQRSIGLWAGKLFAKVRNKNFFQSIKDPHSFSLFKKFLSEFVQVFIKSMPKLYFLYRHFIAVFAHKITGSFLISFTCIFANFLLSVSFKQFLRSLCLSFSLCLRLVLPILSFLFSSSWKNSQSTLHALFQKKNAFSSRQISLSYSEKWKTTHRRVPCICCHLLLAFWYEFHSHSHWVT